MFFTELRLIDLSGGKAAWRATRLGSAKNASAHDTVLEQRVEREPNSEQPLLTKMAWLYEFESMSMQQRPARSSNSVEKAVDTLLATCWE